MIGLRGQYVIESTSLEACAGVHRGVCRGFPANGAFLKSLIQATPRALINFLHALQIIGFLSCSDSQRANAGPH